MTAPLPVAVLLAAVDDPTGLPTTLTLGGFAAVMLGLFVTDKFGSHSERDRLRQEVGAKSAELAAQNTAIREELIPAVLESTRVLSETNRLLPDVAKALRTRPR